MFSAVFCLSRYLCLYVLFMAVVGWFVNAKAENGTDMRVSVVVLNNGKQYFLQFLCFFLIEICDMV